MATQVKLRRGTTEEHEGFTGALGEVTVDTTTNSTVVHDGARRGGFSSELASIASALNVTIESVIYGTNAVTAIPQYIRNDDDKTTYSVPSAAQGKFIQSVGGSTLTTSDDDVYDMQKAELQNFKYNSTEQMIANAPAVIGLIVRTTGFYSTSSLGSAKYKLGSLVPNGLTILQLDCGLTAELLGTEIGVHLSQVGCQNILSFDNSVIANAVIDINSTVIVDGYYPVHYPVTYTTQKTITAPSTPSVNVGNGSARIKGFSISDEFWSGARDGSESVIMNRTHGQVQSVLIENLYIRGWADVPYSNLQNSEDIGVHGIDTHGVRDGLRIKHCVVRNLSDALTKINGTGYTGFLSISDCEIYFNYNAIKAISSTGVSVKDTKIYDCYNWLDVNHTTLDNVSFNNSSFSNDTCGIKSNYISAKGCWFEGGNRWMQPPLSYPSGRSTAWTMDTCTISEAFSSSGATKFVSAPSSSIGGNVEFKNMVLPANTRLTSLNTANDLSKISLKIRGCQNVRNLAQVTTNIAGLSSSGMSYEGFGNELGTGFEDLNINGTLSGSTATESRTGSGNKMSTLSTGFAVGSSKSFKVTATYAGIDSTFTNTPNLITKLALAGHSDGAGGVSVYYNEFVIHRGLDQQWRISAGGTGGTITTTSLVLDGWDVSLSDIARSECVITITKTHAGSGGADLMFVLGGCAAVDISEM